MLPQPKSPQGHFTSMINHTWPDYKQYIKHENSHYSTDKYQNKIHKCNIYNIMLEPPCILLYFIFFILTLSNSFPLHHPLHVGTPKKFFFYVTPHGATCRRGGVKGAKNLMLADMRFLLCLSKKQK